MFNRCVIIRHGQSQSNADPSFVPDEFTKIPLTEEGRRTAAELAAGWDLFVPDLIVTSNMQRTIESSLPMQVKYPYAPRVCWEVQEYSFLSPVKWKGSSSIQRREAVRMFWENQDENFYDGEGAETLIELMARVNAMIVRLQSPECDGKNIMIFSHCQYMNAMRLYLQMNFGPTVSEFYNSTKEWKVKNLEVFEIPKNFKA